MNPLSLTLAFTIISATLAAQDGPRATSSLTFKDGTSLAIAYNQLDLAQGRTLKMLTSKTAEGKMYRNIFNAGGFKSAVKGQLTVQGNIELEHLPLRAGTCKLSFKIDEKLTWHMILEDDDDKEIASIALRVEKQDRAISSRLNIQAIADPGKDPGGFLLVRFGDLSAKISFKASTSPAKEEKRSSTTTSKPPRAAV